MNFQRGRVLVSGFLVALGLLTAGCTRVGTRPVYPVPGEVVPGQEDLFDSEGMADAVAPEEAVEAEAEQ